MCLCFLYFRYLRSLVETILIYKHFTKPSTDPQALKQELVDFWMDFMVEATKKDVTSVRFPVWPLLNTLTVTLHCHITLPLLNFQVHLKTPFARKPFKMQKWLSHFHEVYMHRAMFCKKLNLGLKLRQDNVCPIQYMSYTIPECVVKSSVKIQTQLNYLLQYISYFCPVHNIQVCWLFFVLVIVLTWDTA